jgi:hypothetical protein
MISTLDHCFVVISPVTGEALKRRDGTAVVVGIADGLCVTDSAGHSLWHQHTWEVAPIVMDEYGEFACKRQS